MFSRSVCVAIVLMMALSLPRMRAQIETTTAETSPIVALPGVQNQAASCECPTGMVVECRGGSSLLSRSLSNGSRCYCRIDDDSNGLDSNGLDRVCLQPEKDCSCTRERDPQCNSEGLEVAANSCVAGCYGYRKADANLWNCRILPEALRNDYFSTWDTSIKQEYECKEKCRDAGLPPSGPLCDDTGTAVAESACLASCEGLDPSLLSSENCVSPSTASSSTSSCLSKCDRDTSGPVCDSKGAPLADSECAALCLGYRSPQVSTSTCAPYFRDSILCGCDAPESEDDAVCNAQGTRITGSACLAACLGYDQSDVNKENCGAERGNCICPLIYDPLCDDKGTIMASNTCDANCEYGDEAEVTALMSKDNCDGAALKHDNAACGCAGTEAEAVCDALGTEVAPSSCVASCAGYRDYVLCSEWKPSPSSSSTRTSVASDKLVPFIAPDVGPEATNSSSSNNTDDNTNRTTTFPGTKDPDDSSASTKRANLASVLLLSLQSALAAAVLLEHAVAL